MKDEFSTFDIMKALDIERERLREWMKLGFIMPKQEAAGQGTRAKFTRHDVYRVELFRRLLQTGLSRKLAARFVMSYNEPRPQDHWPKDRLVIRLGARTTKDEAEFGTYYTKYMASHDQAIGLEKGFVIDEELDDEFDDRWDSLHVINLKRLEKETDKALEKL